MSTNSTQLITQLKSLKLSGMADTLDLRLMEAQNSSLSFSEFLSMVITDEFQTRSNRKLQRLLSRAHSDPSKTLETFDFSFNPSINATVIRELATCQQSACEVHFTPQSRKVYRDASPVAYTYLQKVSIRNETKVNRRFANEHINESTRHIKYLLHFGYLESHRPFLHRR